VLSVECGVEVGIAACGGRTVGGMPEFYVILSVSEESPERVGGITTLLASPKLS
jgi:hypothetical protein